MSILMMLISIVLLCVTMVICYNNIIHIYRICHISLATHIFYSYINISGTSWFVTLPWWGCLAYHPQSLYPPYEGTREYVGVVVDTPERPPTHNRFRANFHI